MIIFLFLIETISCDPSSEPSNQDGSDEGSQYMFLCRINKFSLIITKYSLISYALSMYVGTPLYFSVIIPPAFMPRGI